MAQQNLNVGTTSNDGTGDTLRASQIKVQSNFDELYARPDFTDAPSDGNIYGRKDGTWEEVTGGSGTTPTLQEVADALVNSNGHAETTTPIDVVGSGSNRTLLQGDGIYNEGVNGYSTLSSEEISVVETAGNVVTQNKSGFKFQKVISSFVKRAYLNFDNIINDNVIFQFPNKSTGSYNLALESDIPTTATDLDALKRDGNNANTDVDLGTLHSLKASTITIQNNGASKSMKLLASNLSIERTAEFLDQDYIGIEDVSNKGVANGYAPLNSSSQVPSANLPAYVDDIVEGYLLAGVFYEEVTHTTAITGEVGKIYIDLTIGQSSKQYRWSGSVYNQITNGFIASTADVPDSTDKRYQTDAQQTNNDATSSIQGQLNGKATKKSFISLNADFTLNNASTALQDLFGKTANVVAGKKYRFMVDLTILDITSSTSNFSLGSLGTATLSAFKFQSIDRKGSGAISTPATAANITAVNAVGSTSPVVGTSAGTSNSLLAWGTFIATTSGTFKIAGAFSATGGTPKTENTSFFELYELGTSTEEVYGLIS